MALTVKEVESKVAGMHSDGGGLYLRVQDSGSRSWIFRFQLNGKRREMGIGSYPAKSLAAARAEAATLAEKVKDKKVDPLAVRQAEQQQIEEQAVAEQKMAAQSVTFGEAATAYVNAQEAGWKNAKHVDQWRNTLTTYCATFSSKPVGEVTVGDLESVLRPIWLSKTETATRLLQRITLVLLFASDKGWREVGDLEAWPLRLRRLLPRLPKKKVRTKHHAALPYAQAPAFVAALRQSPAMGSKALLFSILCASRSGEVRLARWSEIDLDAALWVIPAERMKVEAEHRVPLSSQALDLLRSLPEGKPTDLVFPGMKKGQPLSDMTMTAFLRRGNHGCTQHGFRSTFADWSAECTGFQKEVREKALAHTVADAVEAAYRRGDLFEKRRELMQTWADYLSTHKKD